MCQMQLHNVSPSQYALVHRHSAELMANMSVIEHTNKWWVFSNWSESLCS